MLARIRLRPRNPDAFATRRCSLGFALHNEGEVARCLAVEGPGECWKVTPDWRVPPPEPRHNRAARAARVSPNGTTHTENHDQSDAGNIAEIVVTRGVVEQAIEIIGVVPTPPGRDGDPGSHE